MTKSFNQKARSAFKKLGVVALMLATTLALAVFFTACKQTSGGGGKQGAPFVEGGASLILSSDKLTIMVRARTEDGSAIAVEGCTETTLANNTETTLTATGTRVVLKGKITELDVSGTEFNKQPLVALNVQGLTSLQELNCGGNKLTSLNVQGLTALQELKCSYNQLTELNVQGLTSLQELYCGGNQLTRLTVQGLTSLQELYCGGNQLTSLNVQGLTALQTLVCGSNKLTELNVQGLTSLQTFSCWNNQLTELNVQGLKALRTLTCDYNQFTELNVQGCTSLKDIDCSRNQLTALNVQGLKALRTLRCSDNQLPELNVQGLTSLTWLGCRGNQLNAQAMTELLQALPAREASDDAKALLYTEQSTSEGNCKDYTQPAELKTAFDGAKSKNWKLQKFNATGRLEEI